MCGIAGIMTTDGSAPNGEMLDTLSGALAHRGPDGYGRAVRGNVGLVHTRLAIIDLDTGDQPFYTGGEEGDDIALVANGEIYNYIELTERLSDVDFATRSDCEPPLHLYVRDGLAYPRNLRGMYAIAVHDKSRDRLVLSRDPFGIKPLYFAETPEAFVFASEAQALVASGAVEAVVNPEKRFELLQLQFTTGAETTLAGIFRVMPGETVVVERGRVVERYTLPALPADGPRRDTKSQALRQLDDVLNNSVGVHQRSDVPYGMFLSGGIDSSVLMAMMNRLNVDPVVAFTAGFPDTDAPDERADARAVAEASGAEHVDVSFDEDDFWTLLPEIAAAMDDPAADYAILPTWKLAKAARDHGLKVILTGEGGDEMFGGYGRYRRWRRLRMFGGRPMRNAGIFDGTGVLRETGRAWRDGMATAERDEASHSRTRLQVAQAVDCADWLPADLLTKLDRCLMAHGVEGRVPFLDPAVADFAFRLPDGLKVHRGTGKWLLRRWLETALPAARPFAPKKGFTVPVADWIGRLGPDLGDLVAAQDGIAEACHEDAVREIFNFSRGTDTRGQGFAAWVLLFYALWHRANVQGLKPQGDVVETLSIRG